MKRLSAIGSALKSVGWMAMIGQTYQPNALRPEILSLPPFRPAPSQDSYEVALTEVEGSGSAPLPMSRSALAGRRFGLDLFIKLAPEGIEIKR